MSIHHLRSQVVRAPAPPVTDPDRIVLSLEQATWLRANAKGNDFLSSLDRQWVFKGYLSPKQVACIDRNIAEQRQPSESPDYDPAQAPRRTPAPAPLQVETAKIEEIFGYAKSRGIKQPQMRLGDYHLKTASAFSANAGAIYVTMRDVYLGKIKDGRWIPTVPGFIHSQPLAELLKDPTLAAIAYGERTGNCAICGRLLTAAESIERTIGPICAANYGML